MTIPEEAPRIISVIGEGHADAIVLTSDEVLFQPPDAEARAAAYVRLSTDLVEAKDLLRELYLVYTADCPWAHSFTQCRAVYAWLALHGVAPFRPGMPS